MFFFSLQKGKMYTITVGYMTESGRQEASFFCPVILPDSDKGRWILYLLTWTFLGNSERLTVWLTFVLLSLRVWPSQHTASPLQSRLYVPATVPLQGLLLQQTAPYLLLPNGWWAAFCAPYWYFHSAYLSTVVLSKLLLNVWGGIFRAHIVQCQLTVTQNMNVRYILSSYQYPPRISDFLFTWPSDCVCLCHSPACTVDRHFVFSVPASLTDPPFSPALLLTLGNTTCKPERVTSEYALFKIPMNGCGSRRVVSSHPKCWTKGWWSISYCL